MYAHVSVSECVHMCAFALGGHRRVLDPTELDPTGGGELPSAGNQTWVFWKISQCS